MSVLAILTSVVLFGLSLLHVYWGAGGRWGIESVVPTLEGRPVLHPTAFASYVVATALAVAGTIAIGATGALHEVVPAWFVRTGLVVMAVVFAGRAIGDFRFIGFTKRARESRFAEVDTFVFSPLCVALSAACAALAWWFPG
jgi:hypothetical protein